MSYFQKTLKEFHKYGVVTCTICHQRNRKDWNICSANTLCSEECKQKMIIKLCDEACVLYE